MNQRCRNLAAMRSKSAPLIAPLPLGNSSCGGHSPTRKRGRPMNNAIRSEQIESNEPVDTDLDAVSEVEEGIREFVRNDIAYLRRPFAVSAPKATLDPGAAAVNKVNSLIHRVAGPSVSEIEKLISELEA